MGNNMEDKIVMGYWDCPSCGSTGIPGTTYDCPNCGRQRGKETKFYMKPGVVEYVPGHKKLGADWYCEYCGALNSAGKTTCENCGSPKSESKDDYFSVKKPKPSVNPTQSTESHKENKTSEQSFSDRMKHLPIWMWLVAALVFTIIISNLISGFVNKPRDYSFDVKEMAWENSVDIEEYRTFRESDWYLPGGARLAYTAQEIRSYQSVLDHYETVTKSRQVESGGHYDTSYTDNGDGTFTEHSTYVPEYTTEYYLDEEPVYRQEPIYDTRYYYDIDRWVHERTDTTSGKDKNTYWPEPDLNDKERIEDRSSKYTMSGTLHYKSFGKDKQKDKTYEIQESWWKDIDAGQTISITLEGGKLSSWQHK